MSIQEADRALILKVKEVLSREDTVLFIGAGLSLWSGLPNWTQLLEKLADFIERQGYSSSLVKKELEAKDLLQAASYGVDQLTSSQFGQFIREACLVSTATPHEIHRKVVNLGPRSFITTNYDRLIEDSLSKWCPDQFFQTVSNKQLTETADIVQARATNFIFKPHGDVGDVDSIILSREQYRILYSERKHILQALETLLVSRPVVFIGFGLRDLDFFYVKDLLANTYKGGTIDHYAIIADVSDQERTYWRKNYGIHLLPYNTIEKPGGGRVHTPLLNLLDELLSHPTEARTEEDAPSLLSENELTANQILAVARYAARLLSLYTVKADLELPLQVSINRDRRHREWGTEARFNGAPVEKFLNSFGENALLIGNPGAGKTYAFKKVSSLLAQQLQDACLNDSLSLPQLTLPIYIDLKLYKGNVWQLAEQALPREIPLEVLTKQKIVRFFLDSFNEMPREHFESGDFEKDFSDFIARANSCPIIIGSRTDEGLQKFSLPVFRVDEINSRFIKEYLDEQGKILEGRFESEVVRLLQKPLFFKLYLEGRVNISGEVHPHQVYSSLFQKLSSDFESRFKIDASIESVLAPIAYGAIEEGRETLGLTELQSQLKYSFQHVNLSGIGEAEFINWLISREILIPASGQRLMFFHQSVTEYLAALELAKLFKVTPQVLEKSLRFTRWDQTLFLTLGFLDEEESRNFIQNILDTDLSLAVRAAKFVEYSRDLVVSEILQRTNVKIAESRGPHVGYLMTDLPVSTIHIGILKELMKQHSLIGGAAVRLLATIPSGITKAELIKELLHNLDDFNYCREIGTTLSDLLDAEDIESLVSELKKIENEDVRTRDALSVGLESALSRMETAVVLRSFLPWQELNYIQLAVLCGFLRNRSDDIALSASIDMVVGKVSKAIFSLYTQITHPNKNTSVNPNLFTRELIDALRQMLLDEESGRWALEAIRSLLAQRPDLSSFIEDAANQSAGVAKLALLYSMPGEDSAFWDEMSKLSALDSSRVNAEPLFLLEAIDDVMWNGREAILVSLLKKRNPDLARHILESFISPSAHKIAVSTELIEPISFWLDWIQEKPLANPAENLMFCDRLGRFLTSYTSTDTNQLFVDEFNKESTPYRNLLSTYLLPRLADLTTERLSESAIQYLLSSLSRPMNWWDFTFGGAQLLGGVATESFVQERLIPLLTIESEPLRSNLREILKIAGRQHRRRYVTDDA